METRLKRNLLTHAPRARIPTKRTLHDDDPTPNNATPNANYQGGHQAGREGLHDTTARDDQRSRRRLESSPATYCRQRAPEVRATPAPTGWHHRTTAPAPRCLERRTR